MLSVLGTGSEHSWDLALMGEEGRGGNADICCTCQPLSPSRALPGTPTACPPRAAPLSTARANSASGLPRVGGSGAAG